MTLETLLPPVRARRALRRPTMIRISDNYRTYPTASAPMDCPRCGHELIPLMDACLNCRWNVAERTVGVKQAPMPALLALIERVLAVLAVVLLSVSLGLLAWTVWVIAARKP